MEEILDNSRLENLYRAILTLKSEEECKNFFRDLCTISELMAMSERFDVVKKIDEGTSYREINKKTGVSTATITRVAHWLHHGMGGYRLALDRIKS
ncbi:MAG: YerC/YecD family TrpR-related protein [Candidatus Gracilibacteria bacterium]